MCITEIITPKRIQEKEKWIPQLTSDDEKIQYFDRNEFFDFEIRP